MKKRLFYSAIISAPILASYAAIPLYLLKVDTVSDLIRDSIGLTIVVLGFWIINVLLLYTRLRYTPWRYILSYLGTFTINAIMMGPPPDPVSTMMRPIGPLLYPFITVLSINTGVLLVCHLILLQEQKENAELELQKLTISSLEAQRQALLQQLQPHFLFNALSTLKSMIIETPVDAESYLLKLSEFLRYSVKTHQNDMVSLADELKFTMDYVSLQQGRFGSSLQCAIYIDHSHYERLLPVYALQTLIENAIKHNSFTERKPLQIEVHMIAERIRVRNNVNHKPMTSPTGTGLANLSQRYRLIGGKYIEIVQGSDYFEVYIHLL
jgi:two-component system, LytTR family, sensor kinase